MEGSHDDDVIVKLYKTRGFKVPEVFIDDEPEEERSFAHKAKELGGLFSALATAFAVGHGIKKGLEDATGNGRKEDDL